jgi:hypothetical protein
MDNQTIATPDYNAVQRQLSERNTTAVADQYEGVAGRAQCGVATRSNQR